MKKLLFLDDIRDPFNSRWAELSPLKEPYKIIWVKNFIQFTTWIEENGLPDAISFDHDLEEEHYTPEEYWSDYFASKDYQKNHMNSFCNGVHCAKWLIHYCSTNNLKLPLWNSHSANPVGKDNINRVLLKYVYKSYKPTMKKKELKSTIKTLKANVKQLTITSKSYDRMTDELELLKEERDALKIQVDSHYSLKKDWEALSLENKRLNQLIGKHGNLIKDNYEDVEVGQYYLCISTIDGIADKGSVIRIDEYSAGYYDLDNKEMISFISRKHFKRVIIREE